MFVHLKDFKRLLKQAYTGVGLCVARRGDDVLLSGSDWVIATEKGSMDKKQLAAVIELTGELPGKGEAFKATKEGNQYEISEVHWEMIDRTDVDREKKEKLTVTPIVLERYPNGKAMRVLQAADGRVEVLNDRFVKAIDSASMNLDYEYEVQGPFFNPKFPKQVYWKSEATTLAVLLYDQDELKEKDILEYLRNIKMEG
ncbi:hypothetical protein [Hominisplanchenecus sp.]|uniref:hypothetical protein n=1 Tax=Hominisplanchenecus sp. TaxID=3038130 RepID=UPI0039910680